MITAELFSDTAAEVQAQELRQLAVAEEAWLEEARPDVLSNYYDERRATEAIRRVVGSHTLTGYILRQDREVIGIGTIVSGLTIKHPDPKRPDQLKLSGDQIDYWTEEISYEDHKAVALTLAEATRTSRVLGILSEAEMERAEGIVAMMEPVGEPGRIKIPIGRGTYGLHKAKAPLQVYIYERSKPDA
jgi:hypothetical protein